MEIIIYFLCNVKPTSAEKKQQKEKLTLLGFSKHLQAGFDGFDELACRSTSLLAYNIEGSGGFLNYAFYAFAIAAHCKLTFRTSTFISSGIVSTLGICCFGRERLLVRYD